jgi:hypothetical protein
VVPSKLPDPVVPRKRRIALSTLLAAAFGCGFPATPIESSSADEAGHDASTTDPSTTLPLPPDPSATSTTSASATATSPGTDAVDSSEGSPFIIRPDGGGSTFECDLEAQDCAPGWKCMPYSSQGGSWWDATACFPVDPDPVGLGEPCEWEGSPWSGIDDCGFAQMCWSFEPGDGGVCKGLCLFETPGDWNTVTCEDPAAVPFVGCQDCFCWCETQCDPLAQDCAGSQACVASADMFMCVTDASGDMGAYGEPCEFLNACDPGLMCANAESVPGCESGVGCCTPFCDVTEPNACPGAVEGQECMPWYEPGSAPQGYENVGVCALPT